jgi:type I restriction enzyme M protein
MGEKGNDGGQFFTPREIIRAIVKAVDPEPGETIYDPCCGTGGFLAEGMKHIRAQFGATATAGTIERLKTRPSTGARRKT